MTEVSGFRASPQQAVCWSLMAGDADHPYWASLELQIEGPCDVQAFERRLQALEQFEEILRTRLCTLPGMQLPIQQIDADAPVARVLQANLRQSGDGRHALHLRAPATHADGASLRLIASYLIGDAPDSERLQYADYAEWKHSLLESADAPGLQYWQQRRAEPAPPLALKIAAARAGGPFRPRSMTLAALDSGAVLAQADKLGCTPALWLSSAWMILMSRLSGQSVLEIGYVDAGRGDTLDNAIGLYEQTLPVRAALDHGKSLRTQIGALVDGTRLALGWRDFQDGAGVPEIGFVCVEAEPWDSAKVLREQCISQRFSLRLSVRLGADCIHCAFDYDPDQWDQSALQILAEQWQLLVSALIDDADLPTGAIALLGPVQRALADAPSAEMRVEQASIVQLIERQAAAHPAAPALADISATLTHGALNERANQLAHRLIRAGVAPGDIVGIMLPRCNDMIIAILAVLKAGGAYLALDPAYPAERLAFMAQDSGAHHVIGYAAQPGQPPHVTIALDQIDRSDDALPITNPGLVNDLSLPAYLIYTSGSSGQPKAVEVSHRSLTQSTQVRMAFYAAPVRAFMLLSSFSFDSSVAGIFWTLAQGGKLVLPASGDELALDTLCQLIERHAVSHSLSLPSLYGALLEHAPSAALATLDTWIVAGEACPDALVAQHHALLPRARLVNEYGPTEGGVWATAEVLETGRATGIGRPIPGMTLALVNPHGAAAAIGEVGEIYLAGEQLANGYRGHPELTEASFASHPHIAGGRRVYRTGDLACWMAEGRLQFLGRRDQQVKIRGHRVELAEIERLIMGHGEVGDAAVVAQEQPGGHRLLAYFTGRHATPPDEGALRNYLAERAPAYMVPALFIPLRTMPLTPNGKRDLNALPDPDSAARMRDQYVAPRNALEQELADICAAVLRLPRVGITDNFFQIGGDSILSLQVVTRATRSGIELTTRQVFEHQSIEAMAAVAQWRQADTFATDVGWLQSWTEPAMLEAFTLCAGRYRMDAGEVLAAVLARSMLAGAAGQAVRLIRQHDAGNGQYLTQHAFQPGDLDWNSFADQARAALRTEADAGATADVCLAVDVPLTEQPARAQAPLQLAVTVLPHALTLRWSADSGHYTDERLQQLSTAVAHGLLDLARHCQANVATGLRTQDFPAAGLDQDALEELLAELNSAGSAS